MRDWPQAGPVTCISSAPSRCRPRCDQALENLTLAQVNEALRRYIQPGQFVLGVAGDFKTP